MHLAGNLRPHYRRALAGVEKVPVVLGPGSEGVACLKRHGTRCIMILRPSSPQRKTDRRKNTSWWDPMSGVLVGS